MAITPQNYPRGDDGLLDVSRLPPHKNQIPRDELKAIIRQAIERAERKSRRAIPDIPEHTGEAERLTIYKAKGKAIFDYFCKNYGDPANTAYECFGRHYADVAREQFRNQTLQKERMNSGWRY